MPFRQPKQYVSSNGVLNITVNVEVTDFVVDWLQLPRRSYDSQIPGPTWRIKRGDTICLRLVRITGLYAAIITFKQFSKTLIRSYLDITKYFTKQLLVNNQEGVFKDKSACIKQSETDILNDAPYKRFLWILVGSSVLINHATQTSKLSWALGQFYFIICYWCMKQEWRLFHHFLWFRSCKFLV